MIVSVFFTFAFTFTFQSFYFSNTQPMTRAIIVEDEPAGLENLQNLLEKHCPTVEIVGTAESNAEFVELVDRMERQPDVAFLDINLPDGKVFEGLEKIDDIGFDVVFVTAFDEYALRAFDVAAIDYILKPYEPQELIRAVSRVRAYPDSRQIGNQIELTNQYLSGGPNSFEKIGISSTDGVHLVRLEEVVRLEGEDNYTHFFLKTGQKITASKTLKTYDDMLRQNNFLRVHKKHIVNLNFIDRYERGDGGQLYMSDKSSIQVSRRKRSDLLEVLRLVNRS